jgi:hypothetical protein
MQLGDVISKIPNAKDIQKNNILASTNKWEEKQWIEELIK